MDSDSRFVPILFKDGSSSFAAIDDAAIAWKCPCGDTATASFTRLPLRCSDCERSYEIVRADDSSRIRVIREI